MKSKKKQTFFKPSVPQPIKNLSWSQAKARFPGLKPFGDADRDGVKNWLDCKPFDIKRQDENMKIEFINKKTGKVIKRTFRNEEQFEKFLERSDRFEYTWREDK